MHVNDLPVNANRSTFKEIVSRVTRSPFSKRIVDVEAPSKYMTLNMMDSDPYECICHFE